MTLPGVLNLRRAVFLDRDGTLIEERNYLSKPEDVILLPGAARAVKALRDAGFKLFIISNQSGIGRGLFTREDLTRVEGRMAELFAAEGASFDKIYCAPEAPNEPSRGRKPSPQFLFDARDEFNIVLAESYVIGDKWIDLECGWNAGVKKSILVRTGYGRKMEAENAARLQAARVVDDLPAAARWILEQK